MPSAKARVRVYTAAASIQRIAPVQGKCRSAFAPRPCNVQRHPSAAFFAWQRAPRAPRALPSLISSEIALRSPADINPSRRAQRHSGYRIPSECSWPPAPSVAGGIRPGGTGHGHLSVSGVRLRLCDCVCAGASVHPAERTTADTRTPQGHNHANNALRTDGAAAPHRTAPHRTASAPCTLAAGRRRPILEIPGVRATKYRCSLAYDKFTGCPLSPCAPLLLISLNCPLLLLHCI